VNISSIRRIQDEIVVVAAGGGRQMSSHSGSRIRFRKSYTEHDSQSLWDPPGLGSEFSHDCWARREQSTFFGE
jgi:hypothetical protein